MGCFSFFFLFLVLIMRHLLNLLFGRRREQAHLHFAWHSFVGGRELGILFPAPAQGEAGLFARGSLWTCSPVLRTWK